MWVNWRGQTDNQEEEMKTEKMMKHFGVFHLT
jgi:hypothetical protein